MPFHIVNDIQQDLIKVYTQVALSFIFFRVLHITIKVWSYLLFSELALVSPWKDKQKPHT